VPPVTPVRQAAPPTISKSTEPITVTANSPTPAELKVLARTDRPLADTVRRAQSAFGDLTAAGGHVTVSNIAGNGNFPVVTVVPPGFDPSKPAKVQTHYHGDRTSAAEANSGGPLAMRELMKADPQRVFVLPEARANVGGNSTDWNNALDQGQTTRAALANAGVANVGEKTVSGHSAGGRALANVMKNGKLDADHVVLLDCLYEPAATTLRESLVANKKVKQVTVVLGSNEPSRADAMVAALPGRSDKVTVRPLNGNGAHETVLRYFIDGSRLPSAGGSDSWTPR
jgi:hypothetical protein